MLSTIRSNENIIITTYLLIVLTIVSCKQEVKSEPESESELKPEVVEKIKEKIEIPSNVDSEFKTFFKFFNKDSTFQISRIDFPLKIMEMNGEMSDVEPRIIELKDYEKMDLTYDKSFETREYDKYTQKVILDGSKARIELRGIDNGIHNNFEFEKIDGQWKMITWTDSST
ncbi:DUF4348 domain-containing protein [Aquimarina macrocephali]|uniref:DUF4348 domain-containing protein n=1 Tax=Aquimarina macrocephali TaxID=666563 RepID=UPI000464F8D6|nr:DUF4348 domain-containing protein [Aquimarina macrocephali]